MALPPRPFSRSALIAFSVLGAALTTPAVASPGHHHHHAKAAPTPTPTPMFVVADPTNPRIARGPRGPLWASYVPRSIGQTAMGQTFAQRYLATQLAARDGAGDPVAARAALTTAQATKKLTKKCQRLVKAKKPSRLSKADRKARTKCLEQRRKLIADSKKKPDTTPGTTTPTSPTSPTGPSSPTSPTAPSAPATPSPTTPAPTTPTTPAPPTACTTPGEGTTLAVTAFDEGAQFELSSCGLKAGKITFAFDNTDGSEDHNLVIADGYNEITDAGQTSSTPTGLRGAVNAVHPGKSATVAVTLAAGDYWLICTVPGHVAMAIKFRVFAA